MVLWDLLEERKVLLEAGISWMQSIFRYMYICTGTGNGCNLSRETTCIEGFKQSPVNVPWCPKIYENLIMPGVFLSMYITKPEYLL